MMLETPQTVFDAYILFLQAEEHHKNSSLTNNLRSALRRYIMPSYGFTNYQLRKLDVTLAQLPFENFKNVEELLSEKVRPLVDAGKLALGTYSGYKSALSRFVNWLREQSWYPEASPIPDSGKYAPMLKNGRQVKPFRFLATDTKGKRCHNTVQYSLKETELTPKLIKQLEGKPGELTKRHFSRSLSKQLQQEPSNSIPTYGLHYFLTAPEIPKRQDKPLREVTFQTRRGDILRFLGWLKKFRGYKLKDLSLELMVDKELLEEFVTWGISEQRNSYAWAGQYACASLNIAKWLHHRRSKMSKHRDIEAITTIREYGRELDEKRRGQGTDIKTAKQEKFLTFEECEQLVAHLKQCCAPMTRWLDEKGKVHTARRSERAITSSKLHYLLVAILLYCPVRQREIREFEIGRTLFREPNGYWVKLSPEDHKTGSKTGKGREYPLPPQITEDMDEWLQQWRPKIQTKCNYVFTQIGSNAKPDSEGKPFSSRSFSTFVTKSMYKATSYLFGEPKRINPHFFRNIAITHQRKSGDPDQQEGLAELMGHSVQEANRIYNLMSSREKTEKARDWWKPKYK